MGKKWTMWLRKKGSWSIAHILIRTEKGKDYTVCGMVYSSKLPKETMFISPFECHHCLSGISSSSNIRSTIPLK